eukprot:c46347_g1_i1 orf=24-347(-)
MRHSECGREHFPYSPHKEDGVLCWLKTNRRLSTRCSLDQGPPFSITCNLLNKSHAPSGVRTSNAFESRSRLMDTCHISWGVPFVLPNCPLEGHSALWVNNHMKKVSL